MNTGSYSAITLCCFTSTHITALLSGKQRRTIALNISTHAPRPPGFIERHRGELLAPQRVAPEVAALAAVARCKLQVRHSLLIICTSYAQLVSLLRFAHGGFALDLT